MPTEINRPAAPMLAAAAAPQANQSATGAPNHSSFGMTPLAIAAILALVLHVASGVMLDRSHASSIAPLDNCLACPTEAGPPQPSLPYD